MQFKKIISLAFLASFAIAFVASSLLLSKTGILPQCWMHLGRQVCIEQYNHDRDQQGFMELFAQHHNALGAWDFEEELVSHEHTINVLRVKNQLAGFIVYKMLDDFHGHVDLLAIDKQCHGCGYGHTLLTHAMNELKNAGAQTISLKVYDDNEKAKRFYTNIGFTPKDSPGCLIEYAIKLA
ncbi:MAG: GNAT family N-acetyltransferase [Candidatus Dependentiae bacterium]|nr:GNAT family N-acetyltransferase [Candidatus Dependentiae bacterium]